MVHLVDAAEAAAILRASDRVWISAASNEPAGLLTAWAAMASQLPEDLTFVQFPIGGMNRQDFTAWRDDLKQVTFFMTPDLRGADAKRLHFLPMHMRTVFDYLATQVDVAVTQVAYDADGVLRAGPNVDFLDAVLASSARVIAQLNPDIVAPPGGLRIAPERISALVEIGGRLPELPPPVLDEVSIKIGQHVAELIRDGDCLQTGIGAIPAAILQQLQHCSDLGMHGGLIDDGGQALIEAGNLTGARKEIDRGMHVAGMGLGSQAFYTWLGQRRDVVLRGANHTHEVSAIRQLSNFVSINSAVEIDLFGQVNAEVVGGRQISGTGGSVDFMRAAKSSKGGRSIVAMTATARGGELSRIVPQVSMVTALRTDVDIVVTEFGVARLANLPLQARKEALIAVADPRFRDQLA